MGLCSTLILSPTFLYLVYLHGADGAIIVLLMMLTLFFLSYLLVYLFICLSVDWIIACERYVFLVDNEVPAACVSRSARHYDSYLH